MVFVVSQVSQGLPVSRSHGMQRAVWPFFLPLLSLSAAFLSVLPEKIHVLCNCNLPDSLANRPKSTSPQGLSWGPQSSLRLFWKGLCSFWLCSVLVYFCEVKAVRLFHAAAHLGNGFSQAFQKTCDLTLPVWWKARACCPPFTSAVSKDAGPFLWPLSYSLVKGSS